MWTGWATSPCHPIFIGPTRSTTATATRPCTHASEARWPPRRPGLHFTPQVFADLSRKGVARCEVTLHVGLGTFRPVVSERIEDHRMETEPFEMTSETAGAISAAGSSGQRIVAVGTTVTRVLESAFRESAPRLRGETDLFIYPGFRFRRVGALLTNFHLPGSTLLMLVCAFAGRDLVFEAYREALKMDYRFYSYGDCMLIE